MILHTEDFKTCPIVIHANGPSKEGQAWKDILKQYNEEPLRLEEKPKDADLTILAWTVPNEETLLEESFEKLGLKDELMLLNIEKPFNWLDKIKTVKDIVPHVKTKYMMCLDSTDVIVSTDEPAGKIWTSFIKNFQSMKVKLIFNAEKSNWPERGRGVDEVKMEYYMKALESNMIFEEKVYRDFIGSESCRFNSGAFIGETEFVKKVYDKVWENTEPLYDEGVNENLFGGDQGFLRIHQEEFFPDMIIDSTSRLFKTLSGVKREEFEIWR